MIFTETELHGLFIIEPEKLGDERGFFSRTWCKKEFEAHGLNSNLVQCSVSFNQKQGTIRGMHYQSRPFEEAKLVRCTQGVIWDVVIDLRADSPTFKKWFAIKLTADNRKMLYVPETFAHGFQTLEDNSEVFYQITEYYSPENSRGIRWNDPAFSINWPMTDIVISRKDQAYPDFQL